MGAGLFCCGGQGVWRIHGSGGAVWSIVCVVNERVRPHVLIPPRLPFSVGCGWAVMRATGRKHGMEGTRSGWFQGMGLEFSRIAIAREGKA